MGPERNVSVFSGWLENGNNMAAPYPGHFFLPLCTVLFSHLGDGAEKEAPKRHKDKETDAYVKREN